MTTRFWAVIPAAGTSQRMGTDPPKQYMHINGSTVLESSMVNFLQHPNIEGIVVALRANDQFWSSLAVAKLDGVYTVNGGETRAQSVFAALEKLFDLCSPDDFVLVHDAARPCLRFKDIDKLITQLQHDEVGGILVAPVVDTIKESHEDGITIKQTLNRSNLWKALTPQMFRVSVLKNALLYCFENNLEVTDEASAIEALGLEVKIVQGQSDNIKITQPEDIALAEYILKN